MEDNKQRNAVSPAKAGKPKGGLGLYFKKSWQLYALLILPLLFTLVFKYGAYRGLVIAFQDYKVAKGYGGGANGLASMSSGRCSPTGISGSPCGTHCC